MIRFTSGNLLDAETEAIVNTVNTVGVMGKGIALQFREAFPANYKAYLEACKAGKVEIGRMFVTRNSTLGNPKWIINFPTKRHWIHPTKIEWVREGLEDLRQFIQDENIRSISLPPLGCGNGGLNWDQVRQVIITSLGELDGIDIAVYEPTSRYHSSAKQSGADNLTPARAMVAEMVRRYMVLGFECSVLEVQKLAWFLDRAVHLCGIDDPFEFQFTPHKYGPYSDRLRHLLNWIDGSFLRCDRRLADARPLDIIAFNQERKDLLAQYLSNGDSLPFHEAMEWTTRLIDGFESPMGMELLATVDWLIERENAPKTIEGVKSALNRWPGGGAPARRRKQRIFNDRLLGLALDRLNSMPGPVMVEPMSP